MKTKRQWIGKTILLLVLIMTIIGFTLPGVLNDDSQSQVKVEPRVCQNDAECYLTCDDQPVKVLCSQNLCQQNSCKETNYYIFEQTPSSFILSIELNGKKVSLANQSSAQDLFTKFEGEEVKEFTSGMSLNMILEKVKAKLTAECLTVNTENYCRDGENELRFMVNNVLRYDYGSFVPQGGDRIQIIY